MAREEPLNHALRRDTTGYLLLILFITTNGPFQFGFHLVAISRIQIMHANNL